MKKMSIAGLVLGTLVLVGCGSNPTKSTAAAADKPAAAVGTDAQSSTKPVTKVDLAKSKRANCEKYTPIGSNRPQYRCLTPAEKAAESEADARELRKSTTPPSSSAIGN